MHGDDEPLHVHLEEEEEREQALAPQHDRLILQHLRDREDEVLVVLKRVVQLRVGLGQRDVQHGDEGLLDAGGALEKGEGELLAGEGFEDRREKGGV